MVVERVYYRGISGCKVQRRGTERESHTDIEANTQTQKQSSKQANKQEHRNTSTRVYRHCVSVYTCIYSVSYFCVYTDIHMDMYTHIFVSIDIYIYMDVQKEKEFVPMLISMCVHGVGCGVGSVHGGVLGCVSGLGCGVLHGARGSGVLGKWWVPAGGVVSNFVRFSDMSMQSCHVQE